MSDEEEEIRPGKDEEEEEDATIEEGDIEEVEVLIGVPSTNYSKSTPYAVIGPITSSSCSACGTKDSVIEIITVSAPFSEISKRDISLCSCENCFVWSVSRKQSKKKVEDEVMDIPKHQAKQPPLWETTSSQTSPTDDELETLFQNMGKKSSSTTSQETKKKQDVNKKEKSTSKSITGLEFVLEPTLDDDEYIHEQELLKKYNREALELGEETFTNKKNVHEINSSEETFIERLAREPKQRIRYCYGGNPLWPSRDMIKFPDPCEGCGAIRKFEFQVTPQALFDIQKFSKNPSEWSTIIIFSCDDSCENSSTETCIVCPAI